MAVTVLLLLQLFGTIGKVDRLGRPAHKMANLIIASLFIAAIILLLWFSYYIKIHDWILIVVINLISTWFMVHNDVSTERAHKFMLFEFGTMALFWLVTKQHRRQWRRTVFWASLTALLAIHSALFGLALRMFSEKEVGPIWFFVVLPIEGFTISATLDWAIGHFGRPHHTRHS